VCLRKDDAMMIRLLPRAILLAASLSLSTATAQTPRRRLRVSFRNHYSVRDGRGMALYFVSQVRRVSDQGSESAVLIEDQALHERFIFRFRFDVPKQASFAEIADVSGKKFIRRSMEAGGIPSSAKTIDGLMRDVDATPNLLEVTDPGITYETAAFSHKAKDSDNRQLETRREWISQLRESLDPHFLESLERMRDDGIYGAEGVSDFYDRFGQIFHGQCPTPETAKVVAEAPDCAFDKAFGFPCTDAQLSKVAAARTEGRLLETY
jgi:hypothetical protein